jgi:predicted Zn-dependent protease with MMP-like domain
VSDAFEDAIADALDALPPALREGMTNVAIVVEDEPPRGERLYGLYEGVPLPERGRDDPVMPDRITIFRTPLEDDFGRDPALLASQVRRTVLHEIAHHFGIDDDRLVELDRY